MFISLTPDMTVNVKQISSASRGPQDNAIVIVDGRTLVSRIPYDTFVEMLDDMTKKKDVMSKLDGFLSHVGVPRP
jgi:hypothetical protein